MKRRPGYRVADAIIGGILGGTAGAFISMAIVFGLPDLEIKSPWIFGTLVSGCGVVLCGIMGLRWGQQFTHTFEDGIREFFRYFRRDDE